MTVQTLGTPVYLLRTHAILALTFADGVGTVTLRKWRALLPIPHRMSGLTILETRVEIGIGFDMLRGVLRFASISTSLASNSMPAVSCE